jgi:1-acyl-sn-glycerol-3-phosphate acyltransferase
MGQPRPSGYVAPPRPRALDVARTLRVVITRVVPHFGMFARSRPGERPATSSAAGLALIRQAFGKTLKDFGIELTVHEHERVPVEGGLVFMWNQESHLDHLVLATAIHRPFISLYNNEVARFPLYGAYMKATGHVHIDRTDEAQWRAGIAAAARRVELGECVVVSPEGTRSWDGVLLPMKRGVFILAEASRRPIICTTVIGGHARLPRGCSTVRPGPMRVVFSDPIETVGKDRDLVASEVASTFERIKQQWAFAKIYSGTAGAR